MNSARSRPTPSTGSAATSSAWSAMARFTYSSVAVGSAADGGSERRRGRRRERLPGAGAPARQVRALAHLAGGAVDGDDLAVAQHARGRAGGDDGRQVQLAADDGGVAGDARRRR